MREHAGRAGRAGRALVGAVAACLAVPVLAAPAQAGEEPVRERAVLTGGHLDLAARLDGGALEFHLKDGTVPGRTVWREPNDVILHFDARHEWEIPETAPGVVPEQLGRAGDTVWVDHSVTYGDGLLWPGWNTEEVAAEAVRSPVTATFTGIDGPEGFFLGQWRDDPERGTVVGIDIDSTRPEPGSVELRPGVHAHPLWFFTEEGVYRIRLEMSAVLASGERVDDAATFTAVVGDIDPADVELPGPETPDEPAPPELPEPPAEPEEPEQPEQPGQPEQPEQPEESEVPREPGDIGGPGQTGGAEGPEATAGADDATAAGRVPGTPRPAGGQAAHDALAATGTAVVPALGTAALLAAAAGTLLVRLARHAR
ncbi:choice-of-anchor M domain-containing protein [Streptomyces johnsoniae]|uniref:Choice-of-anchor M domain-containing protein n=1 Tax=Streptomyces johnsoniae TaxID=3075532 RepID=A0ABU2SBQ0_9ACTN|nr:choice-of-anchor M domain-containing protein [Streptomyces sp. DSM 41886]MDT0446238.1 choice-of-anchor M domain-containing protein [Streptomyces sp. DSM 41886]